MNNNGAMLNLYPDSCGRNLDDIIRILKKDEFKDAFKALYILPSLFQSDLDRGFSVISYNLDEKYANTDNLKEIHDLNIDLKLDFVLNHLSVQSPQFKDLLKNGDRSFYKDFFIDWNQFWQGEGTPDEKGCLIPYEKWLNLLFMRKPGLPVLELPFPDGSTRFYWNTFYQEVSEKNKEKHYLGQMDLNAESEKVWDFYASTFDRLKVYGAKIVRLDAFAYLHKKIGQSNFFNEPGTWEILERLKTMADQRSLTLLPEIHSKHEEGIHKTISEKGYPIYDFFFPGLIIYTIEKKDTAPLLRWIKEIEENNYLTINMLGCHDGIPLLDMQGLLSEEQIGELIGIICQRGGRVKDLYGPDGKKISYYQVNAAFFSALDENENKMLIARAVQMFMPGIPQVWYLDMFGGTNDYEAADSGGHKEINRTNLSIPKIEVGLEKTLVKEQLSLLRFRNTHPAFSDEAQLLTESPEKYLLVIKREFEENWAELKVNFKTLEYSIESSP